MYNTSHKEGGEMLFADSETTGLSACRNSLFSLAIVDDHDTGHPFDEICQVPAEAEIDAGALQVNGMTAEQLRDPNQQSLEDLVAKLNGWLNGRQEALLACKNPGFDLPFLREAFSRARYDWTLGHRPYDLHTLAAEHYRTLHGSYKLNERGQSAFSLDEICTYVGLPPEPKPHSALTGAKRLAESYIRVRDGQALLPEFGGYQVPDYLTYLAR